jgi:hypothetical protein
MEHGYTPNAKDRDAVRRAHPDWGRDTDTTSPAYWEWRGYSVNDSFSMAAAAAARRYQKPGGYSLAADGKFHPWRESDRITKEAIERGRRQREERTQRSRGTNMSERKWSKNVHPHEGALRRYGWSEDASAEERHRALVRSVKEDGYARTIERLDFVVSVNGRQNPGLAAGAEHDRHWLKTHVDEMYEDGEFEDKRRSRGREHEVRAYEKDDGERVRRHLAKNPRRRQ